VSEPMSDERLYSLQYFHGFAAGMAHPPMLATGSEGRCELCGGMPDAAIHGKPWAIPPENMLECLAELERLRAENRMVHDEFAHLKELLKENQTLRAENENRYQDGESSATHDWAMALESSGAFPEDFDTWTISNVVGFIVALRAENERLHETYIGLNDETARKAASVIESLRAENERLTKNGWFFCNLVKAHVKTCKEFDETVSAALDADEVKP